MQTSRSALDRLLDATNESVTLAMLQKAAAAIGREVRLELVSREYPATRRRIRVPFLRTTMNRQGS